MQHNMLAAAKVYKSMKLDRFGELLQSDPLEAERIAAKMINENRLTGYIDQKDQVIYFCLTDSSELEGWDRQILATCDQVNRTLEAIISKHPDFEWGTTR